ncbi:MAG: aspartate aminotransferase [Oceanicoccus sp.]|jgi:aspartate aminotransferase
MTNHASSQLVSPATFLISSRAAELKAEGHPVLSLSIGEPDFPTPAHIKEAAKAAIDGDVSHYTPTGGLPVLKQAVIDKYKREYNIEYAMNEVVCGAGGKQMLFNFFEVVLEPGDEVALTDPAWLSYEQQIKWTGAIPLRVPTTPESNFTMTAAALAAVITANTKVVLINSPGNPTGGIIPKEELEGIIELCEKHDLIILSDDVYEFFYYDDEPANVLKMRADLKERVLVINSVSKTYAMTGWRLGFSVGPADIIKKMQQRQSLSTSNPCSIAQMAAVEALNGPQDEVEMMRVAFASRRDLAVKKLVEHGRIPFVRPTGAFYLLMDIRHLLNEGETDLEFCKRLLEKHYLALIPGSVFGEATRGWIRLSIASNEAVIAEALERLFSL